MDFKKLTRNLWISAVCAVATPALAAGLVEGTSAAVRTVADAATPPGLGGVLPQDSTAIERLQHVATRAPARLSPLAGNDEIAWESVKSGPHVRGRVH